MNYWGGVICGCCVSVIMFTCMMFTLIEQNNELKQRVTKLEEVVRAHEMILSSDYLRGATEFYMWSREEER